MCVQLVQTIIIYCNIKIYFDTIICFWKTDSNQLVNIAEHLATKLYFPPEVGGDKHRAKRRVNTALIEATNTTPYKY